MVVPDLFLGGGRQAHLQASALAPEQAPLQGAGVGQTDLSSMLSTLLEP